MTRRSPRTPPRAIWPRPVGWLLLAALMSAPGARAQEQRRAEDFYPPWAASAAFNQPLLVRDTDSAIGRLDLHPKRLTLEDVARVHGHLCDGLAVAWVALGAGLRSLFADGVVDRTDVTPASKNGHCWADAAGWTTGARLNHGTLGDGQVVMVLMSCQAAEGGRQSHGGNRDAACADAERIVAPREGERGQQLIQVGQRLLPSPSRRCG